MVIPRYFIYLALAGWIAVSVGLIAKLTFKDKLERNPM